MGFRVTPGAPTVAVPTIGMSGMSVTHVSCGFNSHRPPWGVSSLRRAPALQAGGGRGRADTLHQISPVAYARSIRSAENGESSVQLAGLAPSGNSVMRCIRALGARGLSSILSSPTKLCASVPERIDGLRYERSERRFESCRTLHNRATVRPRKQRR